MIDLKNSQSKQGALEALALLAAAKERPLRIKRSGPGQRAEEGAQLTMPKNANIIDVDQEEQQENEREGKVNETETERQTRLQKIKDDANDVQAIEQDLHDIKNDVENKNAEMVRANKAAADKFMAERTPGKVWDFRDFALDLYWAIKSQIAEARTPEDSYNRLDPTYANSDLLMPGQVYLDKNEIPLINVYFDRSGSLTSEDIERGKDAVSILDGLQRKKKLKYKLYWFASHVSDDPQKVGIETKAFPELLQHVKDTKANNVIIFTDKDFDKQSGDLDRLPYVKVKGCVWWMWANRKRALKAFHHLQGQKPNTTYQYWLN